jgi:putative transcription factor
MELCSNCAKFGDEVIIKETEKGPPTVVSQRLDKREKKSRSRDIYDGEDTGEILVADYSKRIMKARNSKGLTKKELASRLNEKLSVISKLERGELRPSDKLIRKLEKELDITLKEKLSKDVEVEKKPYSQGLTLGDIMKMK